MHACSAWHRDAGTPDKPVSTCSAGWGAPPPGWRTPFLQNRGMRLLIEKTVGLRLAAPSAVYAGAVRAMVQRACQRRRYRREGRGKVYLWNDCTVRYFEPEIGIAAVRVLEAAGYGRGGAGQRRVLRPAAFSVGRLDVAHRFGHTNISQFIREEDNAQNRVSGTFVLLDVCAGLCGIGNS